MNRPPNPMSRVKQFAQVQRAVEQTRSYWESILVMILHKQGIKDITINDDDLKALAGACPPNEQAFLITFPGEDAKTAKFRLMVAYGNADRDKILREHAPKVIPPVAS